MNVVLRALLRSALTGPKQVSLSGRNGYRQRSTRRCRVGIGSGSERVGIGAQRFAWMRRALFACVVIPNFVEWMPNRRTRIPRRRHTSSNLWQEVYYVAS